MSYGFRASPPSAEAIEQGLLVCCGCLPYPIVDGIPRLLPNSFQRHQRFAREFVQELAEIPFRRQGREQVRRFERQHALTARAFAYGWGTYETTSREEDVLYFLLAHWR